ncbi:MAG: hypothetical protein KAR42_11170 [candidate division Zixibacteria bacterium]|nr:hypothetical protein [candidate division Zixibacteria bacterium]
MNLQQFNLLAKRLIKSATQREAVKIHMLGGLGACDAENHIHERVTNTVGRDAKRINELYKFCNSVSNNGYVK